MQRHALPLLLNEWKSDTLAPFIRAERFTHGQEDQGIVSLGTSLMLKSDYRPIPQRCGHPRWHHAARIEQEGGNVLGKPCGAFNDLDLQVAVNDEA